MPRTSAYKTRASLRGCWSRGRYVRCTFLTILTQSGRAIWPAPLKLFLYNLIGNGRAAGAPFEERQSHRDFVRAQRAVAGDFESPARAPTTHLFCKDDLTTLQCPSALPWAPPCLPVQA